MYEQTTNENSANDTLLNGLVAAGGEVASEKLSDFLKKKGKTFSARLEEAWDKYD